MEIHSSLTPIYSMFYKRNSYTYIIGLSATIDRATAYTVDGKDINKGMLIDNIAPVCFTYTLSQAVEDGTTKKLRIFVIYHQLDAVKKTVPSGSKAKPFLTTEKAAYDYYDAEFRKTLFLPDGDAKTFRIRNTSAARAKVLYNLQSKVLAINTLLPILKGKTLIFGNSLEALTKITPNVISSKQSDLVNTTLRTKFDAGKIDILASFKMLKQGANLKALDHTIMMSYYSKELDFIQIFGRQRVSAETGNMFVFITLGTQEVKWYKKAMENITNYEEIYCNGMEDCIKKFQELEQKSSEITETVEKETVGS